MYVCVCKIYQNVKYKSLFAKIRGYNRLQVRRQAVYHNIHKYDAINRLQ